MNQDSQFQYSQDIKCKDHPQNPVLFWCKSNDCNQNRIFCLNCQKQNKHVQHYNEDVHIEKSKFPKGLISECQIQFQSTIKSYEKLMSGLSHKFLRNRRQNYQIKALLNITNT